MKANPFLVNIAALRPVPGGRHHVVRAGHLDGLAITGSSVPAAAEVVVDADVEVVDGGVVVIGTVSSTWVGDCRRCLRPVTGALVTSVREVFERHPRVRDEELDDDEAETYPLTGDAIDLVALARDALLLELPMAPLCRRDCAGLCPTCGADRSEAACDCRDQQGHPVWAVLDSLRTHPVEEPPGQDGDTTAVTGGASGEVGSDEGLGRA